MMRKTISISIVLFTLIGKAFPSPERIYITENQSYSSLISPFRLYGEKFSSIYDHTPQAYSIDFSEGTEEFQRMVNHQNSFNIIFPSQSFITEYLDENSNHKPHERFMAALSFTTLSTSYALTEMDHDYLPTFGLAFPLTLLGSAILLEGIQGVRHNLYQKDGMKILENKSLSLTFMGTDPQDYDPKQWENFQKYTNSYNTGSIKNIFFENISIPEENSLLNHSYNTNVMLENTFPSLEKVFLYHATLNSYNKNIHKFEFSFIENKVWDFRR
jgi:hypothetical protein